MKNRLFTIYIILIYSLFSGILFSQEEEADRESLTEPVWIVKESRMLTSSFGEYRTSHFHAGIDVHTQTA